MNDNCRLCLKLDVSSNFLSFSYQMNSSLTVFECYHLFTCVYFDSQETRDNSKICPDCMLQLISFYDYRCKVIKNNDFIVDFETNGIKVEIENSDAVEEADPLSFSHNILNNRAEPGTEDLKIIAVSGSEPLEGKTGKGAGKSAPGWKKTQKNIGQKRNKPDYFENQVWGDEKVLKYSTFLVGYEQVPKPEQRVICKLCGKEYLFDAFKKHYLTIHTNYLKFTCTICSKGFPDRCRLVKHQQTHKPMSEEYICDYCNKKFVWKSSIALHVKHSHKNVVYICEYPGCLKVFNRLHYKTKHYNSVHLSIYPYNCHICKKGFTSKSPYDAHLANIHGNTNPIKLYHRRKQSYNCDVCNKQFKTREDIAKHMLKQHKGNKNYQCFHCPEKFVNDRDRKTHQKEIHGIGKFPCLYEGCKFNCKSRKYLEFHVNQLHMMARNYTCDVCGKMFVMKVSMKEHIETYHLTEENFMKETTK